MSAIFVDEMYDSLDPISQMLEPFQSEVGDFINSMPDEIQISESIVLRNLLHQCNVRESYVSVYKLLIEELCIYNPNNEDYNYSIINKIKDFFTPHVVGDFELELGTNIYSNVPQVFFIKDKSKVNEDNMIKRIVYGVINSKVVRRSDYYSKPLNKDDLIRLKELADILDIDPAKTKQRSKNKWHSLIFDKVESNIINNIWRIRSENAIISLFTMVASVFFNEDNMESQKINLIHFKLMARTNKAIYKIKEI